MTYFKRLIGKRCYLSPCSQADAAKWTEWDNDLEVTIPLGDEAFTPISVEKQQERIDEISKNQSHVFTIVDLETDAPIGRCMLFNLVQVNRMATLGIVIGEKTYWNRGYGQEAIKLLLDYGFNLLNLNNIMLGVAAYNLRAINCYQKVGFKEIGRRRKTKIIGGQRYDVIYMDILAEEFESDYVKQLIEQTEMK